MNVVAILLQNISDILGRMLCGEVGVPREHRDLLQGHVVGSAVATKHYDRTTYLTEKRSAMTAWDQILDEAINGGTTELRMVG